MNKSIFICISIAFTLILNACKSDKPIVTDTVKTDFTDIKKYIEYTRFDTLSMSEAVRRDSMLVQYKQYTYFVMLDSLKQIEMQFCYEMKINNGAFHHLIITTYPGKSLNSKYMSLSMLELAIQSTMSETVYISTHDKLSFNIARDIASLYYSKTYESISNSSFGFFNDSGSKVIFSFKTKNQI